jgi:hypothetical protein
MSFDELLRLIDILKWPAVAVAGLFLFHAAIVSLISRAGFGGKAIDFAEPAAIASEQQQQRQIAKPESVDTASGIEGPPPPPSPALRGIEDTIAAAVAASNGSEEVKRAWLIRGVAVARLERAHETTYRLIMGSQIGLLLQANSATPVDLEAARGIYDAAKATYPEIYKTFDFDNWLKWPANSGLTQLETNASGKTIIKITDIGKEFLHYLVQVGLTTPKIG